MWAVVGTGYGVVKVVLWWVDTERTGADDGASGGCEWLHLGQSEAAGDGLL